MKNQGRENLSPAAAPQRLSANALVIVAGGLGDGNVSNNDIDVGSGNNTNNNSYNENSNNSTKNSFNNGNTEDSYNKEYSNNTVDSNNTYKGPVDSNNVKITGSKVNNYEP